MILSLTVIFKTKIVVKSLILNQFIMKKLLMIAVLVISVNYEFAFSTASTQIWIPSTDFQKWKTMHLGLDNYIRTQKINGVRSASI